MAVATGVFVAVRVGVEVAVTVGDAVGVGVQRRKVGTTKIGDCPATDTTKGAESG